MNATILLDLPQPLENKTVINVDDERTGTVIDGSPVMSDDSSVIPSKDDFDGKSDLSLIFCGDCIFEVPFDDAMKVSEILVESEKMTYLLSKGYSGQSVKIHGFFRK